MTHSVASTFNAHAGQHDALRHRLIPPFEDFYGTAVQALSLAARKPTRILDLGAGTGLLSALIRRAHPDAEVVLVDAAPAMLERARDAVDEPATFVVADLRDPLRAGAFDAIVSALAIHHLDDDAKLDCSPVEDQLHWLRATGFADVDCLFKHHCFAVPIAARGEDHVNGATP